MAKTTRPTITIHDTSMNQVIEREMNDAEFEAYEMANAVQAEADAAEAAKAAEKAALLERLGITAEEAKLLLS